MLSNQIFKSSSRPLRVGAYPLERNSPILEWVHSEEVAWPLEASYIEINCVLGEP